jgi:hypothetical protein
VLPDKVPPLFVKSTELLANAEIGSARASRTIHNTRFIEETSEISQAHH